MDNLFNVTQVAYILKVHPLTVRRYIREGKLKAIKVAGNVRIKESQLQEFTKEIVPKKSIFRSPRKDQSPVKIFTEIDPFFQLQGRGASLNIK